MYIDIHFPCLTYWLDSLELTWCRFQAPACHWSSTPCNQIYAEKNRMWNLRMPLIWSWCPSSIVTPTTSTDVYSLWSWNKCANKHNQREPTSKHERLWRLSIHHEIPIVGKLPALHESLVISPSGVPEASPHSSPTKCWSLPFHNLPLLLLASLKLRRLCAKTLSNRAPKTSKNHGCILAS